MARSTVQEAVEVLGHLSDDLVFMECMLPIMDGLEARRTIREREVSFEQGGRNRVTIVALTANATHEDRERCLVAGMDDYLTKPISTADLATCLERGVHHENEVEGEVLHTSSQCPAFEQNLVNDSVNPGRLQNSRE